MNEGIIASRYAKAFLKLVRENGSGDKVVPQVRRILEILESLPAKEFSAFCQPGMSASRIISLLSTSLEGIPLEKDLCSFISLLVSNRRIPLICTAFRSFLSEHYRSQGVMCGVLKVARSDASVPGLEKKLHELVLNEFGCTLELETREDASLIGGFVFALEDRLLDASVRRQLDIIRRQFVENNRRSI